MIRPVQGGRLSRLFNAWAELIYEKLLPKEKRETVIYDWNGKCKTCGQHKIDKTEWL